ncbi:FGLLP motif-containing membrane protein [Streptomyces sp. NPDC004065]|uniref:FGLLP motif-containing membrane protein n=1 Tax=Streptomyces sp. NPDC004065 TaxID=3364689 RepID=UPI00384AFEE4
MTSDTPSPRRDPSLTPTGVQVDPGASFTVTGADFDCSAGEGTAGPLAFSVQGQQTVDLGVDDSGGFRQPVTVPADAAPGTYTMQARCTGVADAPTASGSFEVRRRPAPRPEPRITLSPGSGRAPARPVVTGTGFLCEQGTAVDVLWDGKPAARSTPGADGGFSVALSVPSSAREGGHEVTASCGSPAGVRDSATFTVDPAPVSPSPQQYGTHDVTIHAFGYPEACTAGAIVVGGRRLDTWLDEGSTEGSAAAGRWELIDLHAHLPEDLRGRRDVALDCPGRAREKAGEIVLPASDPLTFFVLPVGSPVPRHDRTGHVTPTPTGATTSAPPSGGPSASGGPGPGPVRPSGGTGGGNGGGNGGTGGGTGGTGGGERVRDLVESLRTPADVSWALKDLAGSAGMAAWFLLLVLLLERAFPSQLADNALSRWWRRRQEGRQHRRPRLPGWARMCGFALFGGGLAVWADAGTGWGAPAAVKAVGAAAGMLMVLVAYEKTKESLLRPRRGDFRSELRVVPAGLLLAVLMTALSRFLEFPVPYVYGLIAVYMVLGAPRPEPDGMPKGQAVLVGGICVLAAAVFVWVLGAPLVEAARKESAGPLSVEYALAYAVGLAVVAGIEVVVFALLPLSGMDGHALKQWNKPAWFALYLTGLTFFFHVLLSTLHPGVGRGLVPDGDLRWWTLGIATALFLAGWALSLALRWYVARAGRRA